jgi:predicted deacylase
MNQRQKSKIQEYLNYFKDNQSEALPHSMELDSGVSGKHILLVSSLGGDETPGAIAMIKLHKLLKNNPGTLLSGKITFLLGNPQGFRQNEAFLHKPLNSLFTNIPNNSYEGKRATSIQEYLLTVKPDLVLDFHSQAIGEMRMVTYRKEQMAHIGIIENISDISYYAAFKAGSIDGKLVSFCADHNIIAFALECGNIKSKKSIGISFDHMVRTLEYFEMVTNKRIPKLMSHRTVEQVQLFDIREAIVPNYNFHFVSNNVKTGLMIKKGEVYATYEGGHLVAHEDCFLFLPNKFARNGDQNAGFLCKIYKFKRDTDNLDTEQSTTPNEQDDANVEVEE